MAEDEKPKEQEVSSNKATEDGESGHTTDEVETAIPSVVPVKEFDHEKFRNIAAGVQSSILALAVLIGGIWTVYLFRVLDTKGRAIAERHAFELRDREQGVINIEISAKQVSVPGDKGRNIFIDIQVKNLGNRNNPLGLGDKALTVAKVRPDNEGRLNIEWAKHSFVPYLDASKLDSRDRNVDYYVLPQKAELMRAGQTVSFPCWFHVEEAGLYLIDFETELKDAELTVTQKAMGETTRTYHVTGQTFVVVE